MIFFDSHCHLTDEKFAGEVAGVVERAVSAGVRRMITIASDLEDARAASGIALAHESVWSTIGVHPHVASGAPAQLRESLVVGLSTDRVVALGETGLDFHYDNSARPDQRKSFATHLDVARETGRPIIVHSRSADDEMIEFVNQSRGIRGVLHCFSGGDALLDAAIESDWYVSFAGVVSFRNFSGAEMVRRVPRNRLLIETDSPYLAPIPMRGKRNEPAFVVHVAAAVATHLGCTQYEVAELTTANAMAFYDLKESQ